MKPETQRIYLDLRSSMSNVEILNSSRRMVESLLETEVSVDVL